MDIFGDDLVVQMPTQDVTKRMEKYRDVTGLRSTVEWQDMRPFECQTQDGILGLWVDTSPYTQLAKDASLPRLGSLTHHAILRLHEARETGNLDAVAYWQRVLSGP